MNARRTGIIFDIKEFALNDGDGIRTTVFFKGCPLRCIWCHNPEGLSPDPELYVKKNGCLECGLCKRSCSHEECQPFGRCLHICPSDLICVAGKEYDVTELAEKLLLGADTLASLGGGVTLSGGEPLMQHEFVYQLLSALKGKIHRSIETSGFADKDVFKRVASECDFVIMDIKIVDPEVHKRYTGADNRKILENAEWLKHSGIPHLFRTPLIPGITDTEENLIAISEIVGNDKIELLPYNHLAGAKYESVGRSFSCEIDETLKNEVDLSIFKNAVMRK